MSKTIRNTVLALCLTFAGVQSFADDIKLAVVVSFGGTVEVFSALGTEAAPKEKSLVIFDGQKYMSRRVQSGMKVYPGDILRSGNDGKMKIIYNTGDVFILGPATAFTVPQELKKGPAAEIKSEVLYGKVRAMIDKKGPLKGLNIKTPSMVAGVRGTDLYVSYNPLTNSSQVHVLRGEVQVKAVQITEKAKNASLEPEPAVVKTGQKAVLEIKPATATVSEVTPAVLQVLASTQADLKGIAVATTPPQPQLAALKMEEKAEVEKLLKTSQDMVIEDIKVTTPEVYKALEGKKPENLEAITEVMVQDLAKTAPKGSTKPKMSDFNQDEDVYKKYFKPVSQ